jgi:CxxC motif-containing protein (DUF1111 family)
MELKPTILIAALLSASCAQMCPDNPVEPDPEPEVDEGIFADTLGEPMAKATDEQRETFEKGQEVALMRFDTANGLGPNFNVSFCGACHEQPTLGGSSPRYRDFPLVGTRLEDGSYITAGVNGVQAQFNTETAGRNPTEDAVNTMANRNAIPFFGTGALAAIDEEAILANVDEDDADGDGISGRPNYDRGFVGRFGRKSQTVSIEGFIRGPLFNHLGVTTVPLSQDLKAALPVPSVADQEELREQGLFPCVNCQAAAPAEPNFDEDGVPDPEMSEQQLFDLVSFSMILGAPRPDEPTDQTRRGEKLFEDANCTGCHVPALEGPDGLVPAYSDLLLHDMGEELADGVDMGVATGSEFRTQPLWGVAAVAPYLHDGRANTLDEAIRLHGGEASDSRDAYEAMTDEEREDIIAFLRSLGGADQASEGLIPPDEPLAEAGNWGGPLRELDDAEAEKFLAGRSAFDRNMTQPDGLGLGKGFNGDSCRACHFDPVPGGAGPAGLNVTRQGIVDPSTMEYTEPDEGTMVHHFQNDRMRPSQDPVCNVIELRQTPTLFGLGLVDAIPEDQILSREDPEDADDDGISGKARRLADGRVGRFGWKAPLPTLEDFVRDALSNELGLTLADGPQHVAGVPGNDDDIADPEFGGSDYEALVYFSQMLAPPPRGDVGDAERRGEQVFVDIGCEACHTAEMTTADGEPVPLYSDLLLHDVAPEGYLGIEDGDATIREFRTPPLWGLRSSAPYMHDGLAPTIEVAIQRHESEGEASRLAYEELSDADRADLIAFLESL